METRPQFKEDRLQRDLGKEPKPIMVQVEVFGLIRTFRKWWRKYVTKKGD